MTNKSLNDKFLGKLQLQFILLIVMKEREATSDAVIKVLSRSIFDDQKLVLHLTIICTVCKT